MSVIYQHSIVKIKGETPDYVEISGDRCKYVVKKHLSFLTKEYVFNKKDVMIERKNSFFGWIFGYRHVIVTGEGVSLNIKYLKNSDLLL